MSKPWCAVSSSYTKPTLCSAIAAAACASLIPRFSRCKCAPSSKPPSNAKEAELKCYLRSCTPSFWTGKNSSFSNRPRAALLAGEIAEVAEFFSFGTNDLTQTTMGLSRDDAGRFLPDYVDEKKAAVFSADPFQSLDTKGVGMLMRWGIEQGRKTRPKLKIGICGEHGGDADSVKFCHQAGMDYVSASPFRVPISRLAAAQVVVEEKQAKKKKGK